MDIVHKVEEEDGHNNKSQFERDQLVVTLSSLPVLNLLPGDRYFCQVKLDNLSRIFFKSQMAQKVCDSYIILDEGARWEYVDENGKTRDHRKSHLFRQMYGQVVYPVFYANSNRELAQILIKVMGHSDTPSSRSFAFSNYDTDIEVRDIEAIKQAQ